MKNYITAQKNHNIFCQRVKELKLNFSLFHHFHYFSILTITINSKIILFCFLVLGRGV